MAVFKTYKFKDLLSMQLHLQGAVSSGKNVNTTFPGLVGKTAVFTKPAAATVTFTAAAYSPTDLNFKEVKAQIEAGIAGSKVYSTNDGFYIIESTPSQGIKITGGTGLAILGFDKNNGAVNVPYNYADGVSAAVAPHFVTAYFDQASGSHVLIVRE